MADSANQENANLDIPECLAGWEIDGRPISKNGLKAHVVAMRDGVEVFADIVSLSDERAVRKWVSKLAARPTLTEVERDCIVESPVFIFDMIRKLVTVLLDRREAEKNRPKGEKPAADAGLSPCEKSAEALATMPPKIVEAAKRALANEGLLDLIESHTSQAIAGERSLVRLTYLFCCSRLLDRPVNLIVTGASASGKTFITSQVGKFMPPETKILAQDFTESALYYMKANSLKHRIILGGERRRDQTDANADRTRGFREMISAGELRKQVPQKGADGQMETVEVYIEGPIALAESTTVQEIDSEDANRCVVIGTDERPMQSDAIMEASDRHDELGIENPVSDDTYQLHFAIQRLLQRVKIRIPYAGTLGRLVRPRIKHNLECRRQWMQVKQVIKACVVLHQRQRDRDDEDRVIATVEDYAAVREILGPWLAATMHGEISQGSASAFERLTKAFAVNESFTLKDAVEKNIGGSSQLRQRWLPELEQAGVVARITDSDLFGNRNRRKAVFRLTTGVLPQAANSVLPTVEELTAMIEIEAGQASGDLPADDDLDGGDEWDDIDEVSEGESLVAGRD